MFGQDIFCYRPRGSSQQQTRVREPQLFSHRKPNLRARLLRRMCAYKHMSPTLGSGFSDNIVIGSGTYLNNLNALLTASESGSCGMEVERVATYKLVRISFSEKMQVSWKSFDHNESILELQPRAHLSRY